MKVAWKGTEIEHGSWKSESVYLVILRGSSSITQGEVSYSKQMGRLVKGRHLEQRGPRSPALSLGPRSYS